MNYRLALKYFFCFLILVSCNTNKRTFDSQMARFPGCENEISNKDLCAKEKMLEFVYKCVDYPNKFSDKQIEGTIVILFDVLENGGLEDIRIGKGLNIELDKAVVKCFNEMENWIPSKDKNGKTFRTEFTFPITFSKK